MPIKDDDKKEILGIVKDALKEFHTPPPRNGNEDRRKTDRRKPVTPPPEKDFLDELTGR